MDLKIVSEPVAPQENQPPVDWTLLLASIDKASIDELKQLWTWNGVHLDSLVPHSEQTLRSVMLDRKEFLNVQSN